MCHTRKILNSIYVRVPHKKENKKYIYVCHTRKGIKSIHTWKERVKNMHTCGSQKRVREVNIERIYIYVYWLEVKREHMCATHESGSKIYIYVWCAIQENLMNNKYTYVCYPSKQVQIVYNANTMVEGIHL